MFAGMAMFATTVFVAASGCTVTTGATNDDGGIINTDSGGVTNESCNECLFQQCGGQWAVCEGSAECMAIYRCAVNTCNGDANCVRTCFDAHPTGQNAYTALYTCDQQGESCTCKSTCNGPEISCPVVVTPPTDSGTVDTDAAQTDAAPIDTDATTTPAPDTCTDCTNTRCANEKQACAGGSECDAYAQCSFVCADQACTDACAEAHPTGKTDSDGLANCTTSQCKTECNL